MQTAPSCTQIPVVALAPPAWRPAELAVLRASSALIPPEQKKFAGDPLGWVLDAFPWGRGELAKFEGPQEWQVKILKLVAAGLPLDLAIRLAVSSGHGIGKSALVAWLVLWSMATAVDTRGVVTANTDTQLRTKTWPEVAKWFRLAGMDKQFHLAKTSISSKIYGHTETWRIDAVPWSENNSEAFAGLHNQGKRLILIFDEASKIPPIIWEVAEGALTDIDTEIIWCAFGNPTQNTGRFRECFGLYKALWKTLQVDSRTVDVSNKVELAQWIETYGEDSDFVRTRVLGVFPRVGDNQFIGSDVAEEALKRYKVEVPGFEPLIMGVDVARSGTDKSVIRFRRGRSARTVPPWSAHTKDTMFLVAKIGELMDEIKPDAVFIDGGGVGGPIVDRLRQQGRRVQEVQFGGKADRDPGRYANKRSEMWGLMRDWLGTGAIDECAELMEDLLGPEYGYNAKDLIQLEKKKDMKKRGVASPDDGDALALTFAYPVPKRDDHRGGRGQVGGRRAPVAQSDFDPYEEAA